MSDLPRARAPEEELEPEGVVVSPPRLDDDEDDEEDAAVVECALALVVEDVPPFR